MIRLFPNHTKSYYRKGEVLAAMQVSAAVLKDAFVYATHLFLPVMSYVIFSCFKITDYFTIRTY
jgi:hypothetical protein